MCKVLSISIVVVLLAGAAAWADWDLGDPHKMHYPQLPDPNGWDVNITRDSMFDDWQCSKSGPVDDIHFWASWENDTGNADPNQFLYIRARIWDDMPVGDPENPLDISRPDNVDYVGQDPVAKDPLWERYFSPAEFTMRHAGQGNQGWFDPQPVVVARRPDHLNYYQINIDNIVAPFQQEEGKIYWLGLHAAPVNLQQALGWKTSNDHWNDDAVFYWSNYPNEDPPPPAGHGWRELIDPDDGQTSLDLAFVITPEPATLGLLLVGGLALMKWRK